MVERSNMENFELPAFSAVQLTQFLREKGYSISQILEGSHITKYTSDARSLTLKYKQFRTLVKNATKITGNRALGLEYGKSLRIWTDMIYLLAFDEEENIYESLDRLKQFQPELNPLYSLKVHELSEIQQMKVELVESVPLEDIEPFVVETTLVFMWNLLCSVNPVIRNQIRFDFRHSPQTSIEKYREYLPGMHYFEQETNSLYVPMNFAHQKKFNTQIPKFKKEHTDIAKEFVDLEDTGFSIDEMMVNMILENKGNFVTKNDVANQLNVSTKTLQRRLANLGESYSDIVKRTRFAIASDLLINTTKSIRDISVDLGYSDAASFRKAFKTWSGISPSEFRVQQFSTRNLRNDT